MPLARNKFGATVAGAVAEKDHCPILILPWVVDQGGFLRELFQSVLPEMFPHLFPEHAAFGWVRGAQYELPNVVALQRQIGEVEAAAREKTETLTKAITAERAKWEFLHDLLRETGDPLVEAVKTAMAVIGFSDVRDSDRQASGGRRWEDLQVYDRSPVLLVEIKGVVGTGTEHDAIQVGKYLAPRMKEWKRTDVSGLSIINHQRNLPGLDRSTSPFTDVVLENALSQGFGLITTWDLFRLVRNFLQLGWKPEDLQVLFYQAGRIEAIPAHYEFVGVIERYSEKLGVVGVSVSGSAVRLGDRIAFELPIDFVEQSVDSLEVDRQRVSEAAAGSLAGAKTELGKEQARKGVRVFRIKTQ